MSGEYDGLAIIPVDEQEFRDRIAAREAQLNDLIGRVKHGSLADLKEDDRDLIVYALTAMQRQK